MLFHFRLTKSDPFLVIIVRACCAGLRFMCAKIPFVSVVDSNRLTSYLFLARLSIARFAVALVFSL